MATSQTFSIPDELHRTEAFWQLLERHLNGVTSQKDNVAEQCGAVFLHLGLDHLAAIGVLIDSSHFSSALSLMRPQYEAVIRGAWFSFVATNDDMSYFLEDRRRPKERDSVPAIRAMIRQLTDARSEMKGLEDIHAESWGFLNDYTHGGLIVTKSRFQGGMIQCAITEKHAAACLAQARRTGIVAAIWLSEVMGRPDLATLFYEHLREQNKCAVTTKQ